MPPALPTPEDNAPPLWAGPEITGRDRHFADPVVEAAYLESMLPANRARLAFVIVVVLAIAAVNITLDAIALDAAQDPMAVLKLSARMTVLVVGGLMLRWTRRSTTHARLQRLALASALLWWSTRIATLLVPDQAVYGGTGMIIGATALFYIGLPIDARVHIPLMAAFSLSLVVTSVLAGALRGAELISTLLWLIAIQAMGGATLIATRLSLRRSYAQGVAFEHLALHDPLTGLVNRRGFQARLAEAWERAGRTYNPISLITLDLDQFQRINVQLGHLAGDAALRQVAAILQGVLGAGPKIAARIGGEEFACLLPGISAAEAADIAASITEALTAAAITPAGAERAPELTASLGVATAFTTQDETPEGLFALADRLLAAAKDSGRGRIVTGLLRQRGAMGKV